MPTASCQHDHDHSHQHEQPDGRQRDPDAGNVLRRRVGSRSERDGIIGNALLQDFVVTVDYTRRSLVLQRR